MSERARIHWHKKPKCWDDDQAWSDWMQDRQGARSPCADCTPDYRAAMRNQLRCERPEVIFVRDADGEVSGICADDPAYARLLMGLSMGRGAIVLGRSVEMTDAWVRLLTFVRRRAHREVQRAIDIWVRRARKEGA